MNKEKLKIDEGLAKKFDDLVKEEDRKIGPEQQLRKSIWALEVLKQENRVNPDMALEEVLRIITERMDELRQTLVYSKETVDSRAGDEIDAELHDVAKNEVETAKRLLSYMQAAWFTLQPLSQEDSNSYMTFKDIENRLKEEQAAKEFIVDQDEEIRRRENK